MIDRISAAMNVNHVPHSDDAEAMPTPDAGRQLLRILLVEDHVDTAAVMARLLKMLGHEVRLAHSVESALREAASGSRIDLLISDIGLPDGTGFDVLRGVRQHGSVPAIALSGFGMDHDIARSREAGFAEHLTKPVNFDRLEAVIESISRNAGQFRSRPAS